MSNVLFLGIPVIVTAIGCTILLLRQRKPTGVDDGIAAFQRELNALAPDREPRAREDGPAG